MAGKITRLTVQARNKNRVNVYLDGEFAFGLAGITAAWLKVGQQLSDEKIAELRAADAHEAAYERSLRFLSYRLRSEAEVRDHLRKKGLAEELIEPVLARLRRAGLVDDEAFARFWVENRETFRPKGRIALGAELRLKGLSREVIDRALGGLDEDEAASRTAMKQAARYRGLGWPEFRAKLGGYLLRRGFTYETISPIVERAWQAVNGASPGDEFPD